MPRSPQQQPVLISITAALTPSFQSHSPDPTPPLFITFFCLCITMLTAGPETSLTATPRGPAPPCSTEAGAQSFPLTSPKPRGTAGTSYTTVCENTPQTQCHFRHFEKLQSAKLCTRAEQFQQGRQRGLRVHRHLPCHSTGAFQRKGCQCSAAFPSKMLPRMV